jgi:hypothetical protein
MSKVGARYIIGIDLGTTHTVVAYADTARLVEGQTPVVTSLAMDQLVAPGEISARPLLPSLRYHASDEELRESDTVLPWTQPSSVPRPRVVVGQLARVLGNKTPARLVSSAKSWLSHAQVDRTAPILPWGAPEEVSKVSPVEASASYLTHVRDAWNARFASSPIESQEVILTVPASFDEGARALTLSAAKLAGFSEVRLVEEPQAAFYDFLARHRDDLEAELADVRLALVVDVGGGTTDLTLIQVELRESGPRLTRIAVGEHLMLGGDNMDLALARIAEERLSPGAQLPAARFSELLAQAREAKERLLSEDAPSEVAVTLLGAGSKLIGGTKSTTLTRDEVTTHIVDGFVPSVSIDVELQKRRGALVEFGLPFASDAAITRHIATFLRAHQNIARQALGDRASADTVPIPDAILFNGGVFKGTALRARLEEVLASWRGAPLARLDNDAPDLAVARGAAAYGLARRGLGVRIGGGSPRSYHVVVEGSAAERKAICLLPRGADEGEEVTLSARTFSLRLGEPVRFHLVATQTENVLRAGDLVDVTDAFVDLPPISAILERTASDGKDRQEVRVRLSSQLTEIGTLQVSAVAEDDPKRRWKLESQLRGEGRKSERVEIITELHPRFEEATQAITRVFGKSAQDVDPKAIKTLRADLERILGARETWNTPLLRELFGALLAGAKRRRRSADHERVWFNLAGFCLRPGFGYPLDEWRVSELWKFFSEGVQFVPEAQVWAEYWTMWRRVVGGLPAEAQRQLVNALDYYVRPPSPRPRPRPAGPKMLGYDDMVRLLGSLELLDAARKVEIGGFLIERLQKHGEPPQSWWAVGRLGSRVPYSRGAAHLVIPRANAQAWLDVLLAQDWKKIDQAAFAATQLSRMSGDRERDLDESSRARVIDRLLKTGAPPAWIEMVKQVSQLGEAEERKIFGDSLPPGLRLVE